MAPLARVAVIADYQIRLSVFVEIPGGQGYRPDAGGEIAMRHIEPDRARRSEAMERQEKNWESKSSIGHWVITMKKFFCHPVLSAFSLDAASDSLWRHFRRRGNTRGDDFSLLAMCACKLLNSNALDASMRALARYSILSSAPMYRFGVFELHPQRGELRKHGFPVRLAPQPFQLLTILLEHPGELVSREELRARLWDHDGTTVEFDAGLNRCIRQIRAVLTDDAEAPRYIETAPRKGYRFIAPVEQLTVKKEDVSAASVAGLAEPKAVSHRMPVWRVAAATFLALALAASVTLWVSSRPKLSADLNIVPLAVALGHQFAPAFSPDGRQVAFVWDGESRNNFDIYIKIIGSSSAPLRLTTSEDIDYSPAWSPDGRWIAFCRGADSRGGAIFVVSALGGVERKVIDLDTPGAPANRSISWSSNSESLVVACRLAHKTEKGLYVVNVETGEPHRLTTPGPDEEDLSPAVSPDGRMIAFTRDTARGVSSIMLLPFGGAQSPRTLPGPVSGGPGYHKLLLVRVILTLAYKYPERKPSPISLYFSSVAGNATPSRRASARTTSPIRVS
jgi:DNA-binding winged helix-turn-helix (wHTH) protein